MSEPTPDDEAVRPATAPVDPESPSQPAAAATKPAEVGGPKGLEPTRYGDWERKGRCVDF